MKLASTCWWYRDPRAAGTATTAADNSAKMDPAAMPSAAWKARDPELPAKATAWCTRSPGRDRADMEVRQCHADDVDLQRPGAGTDPATAKLGDTFASR